MKEIKVMGVLRFRIFNCDQHDFMSENERSSASFQRWSSLHKMAKRIDGEVDLIHVTNLRYGDGRDEQ